MKKILTISLSALIGLTMSAEDFTNGNALIPLSITPLNQQEVPQNVQNSMKDKLMQVAVSNGLGNSETISRFVITSSIVETSKDFIAGPPKQVSAAYDITFYIVDNFDHKIFSSTTVNVRGIDYSIDKAMLKAVRNIKQNSPAISSFVEKGKSKIVQYFNSQVGNIIASANLCASQRNYDEAFYLLASIPEACQEAYGKAIDAGNKINKEWLDYQGEQLLAQAKAAWAAEQNSIGAEKAGSYLSQIDPDAKCRPAAEVLYKEIKAKVLDDWKFEMKIYQDSVDIEKLKINAWKTVGVAYGNHQPNEKTTLNWLIK